MPKMKIGDQWAASVVRNAPIRDPRFLISSFWDTECYRKGELLWEEHQPNVVTDEGINFMLDVMFHGVAAEGTWYISIFENNVTPLVSWTYDLYADSLATESTAYDELTRVAYVEAAAGSLSITNSANKAEFTMNATKTIYGAVLVSLNTKSDHTVGDFLFCGAPFAVARAVESGDILKITITITGADT